MTKTTAPCDLGAGTGTSLREPIVFANESTITFNLPQAQKAGGAWTSNLTGALPNLTTSINVNAQARTC